MIHKIKKTLEVLKKQWLVWTIRAIYYYFTINIKNIRKQLTHQYIKWNGIEIGWLNSPAPINPETTQVKYVDYLDEETLKDKHIKLKGVKLQSVDYLCMADNLHMIASGSQDFVIGNHLFEHLNNPIKTLLERYRVLKNWWIIFMAIPDKRRTLDECRERTPLNHIIWDFTDPSEKRDWENYLDFASIFFDNSEDIEKEAKRLLTNNDSIHYHVFIEKDIVDIIDWCNKNTKAKFDIVKIKHTTKNPADNEFIIILKVIK